MRTLVIAGDYPWPADRGPRMRLGMVLRGLRRCGPVELVSVVSSARADFGPPDTELDLDKVARVGFDNRPRTGAALAPSLWRPAMPLGMPWQDRGRVQGSLARFVSGRYDLVWFFGARPWVLAGERSFAPTVVDLDDLEDQKIAARLAMPRPRPAGIDDRLRRVAADALSREEIRRWRRLHRRAAARASAIVVCSRIDAARAAAYGVTNVTVVPNGYRTPARSLGRTTVGDPPVVLFQGLLRYPPNVEAARFLAHQVAPLIRELVPDVQVRLVGEHLPDLLTLHDPPRVTVVGRVPDMATELARADLVVVPVRYGSGTRIKIVEAFAHRIPVVSTALGAEGLEAEDGEHLLLGDSPPSLAAACVRLLGDQELRESIVARAFDLFTERFTSEAVERDVSRLAREVAGAA